VSTPAIDFSDLGAKPVQASGPSVDFSDLGGKPVGDGTPAAPPSGYIQATPQPQGIRDSIANWADNVANDIKNGTDITGVGSVLKKMGAQGVYKGNPEAVGDFMASLPLGLLRATKGAAEVTQSGQQWQGAKDMAGGAMQASTIPGAFVAPEAAEAAGEQGGKVLTAIRNLLPSKERAGQLFNSVAGDANQVPVSLDNASDGALRLMDWQQKTNLGPTINKFLNRITSPKLGPLTYEEARDYQSLLGNLSANEKMNLPPMVKSDVDTMLAGLKTDVGNAADQVGRGPDYYSAMKQYRQAAQLQDLKQGAKDVVIGPIVKGAAYGIGGAAVGGTAYKLWQLLTGK
jgi:hypothetical protein